jgi:plastocyanin
MRTILLIFALLSFGCDKSQASGNLPVLPKSVAGSGIIRGIVRFTGSPPVMKSFTSTEPCCQGDPQLAEETVVIDPNSSLRNVFVYLEGAPQTDGSDQPACLLDQLHCRYVPHAVGVQVGQTLRIRSSDPTMHNVHFNPDRNRAKNLALTQVGAEVPTKFEYAEFIRMKCDVHPWMTAWVGVFENPFYSVTQDDGAFEIKGVPAGTYTLVAWHELYGRQRQSVTIADDKPVEAEFVFGRPS